MAFPYFKIFALGASNIITLSAPVNNFENFSTMFTFMLEAVSKVTDTASFFTYTKQNSDFPKPELCHVPDFLYLWT